MTSTTTDPPPEPIPSPQSDAALAASAKALLSASAVRGTARRMLDVALSGGLEEWRVELDKLPAAAEFVARIVRDRYPRLNPPLHARWRHFVFGGRDLWQEACAGRSWESPAAAARAAFDLAIISVLLDAGAGARWQYADARSGVIVGRSEGLALASLRWFESGGLSDGSRSDGSRSDGSRSDGPSACLRADAAALRRVDARAVEAAFQSRSDNPLLGAEGRAGVLNRLGTAVEARPDLFAVADSPRPGGLFDVLAQQASRGGSLPAAAILELVLEGLGAIWPDRPRLGGVSLGDCWPHPALARPAPVGAGPVGAGAVSSDAPGRGSAVTRDGADSSDSAATRESAASAPHSAGEFVPLHKLSQWLSYSLIEPLEAAGIRVYELGGLTGLAEYRNGGLFVDLGVLVPRDPGALSRTWRVADPFVVGWRALTVALLDEIAPMIAARLGLTTEEFPLAKVLEGGTWAAGRSIAREKRADGGPPFHILSDGTVF